MTDPASSFNLLRPDLNGSGINYNREFYHRRHGWLRLFIIISLVAAIVAAMATAYQVAAPKNDLLASALRQVPVVREFAQWLRPDLRGLNADTVPIVLAGISGTGNDGPLLTDTLMVAVLKPSTGKFALVSVPRDLAVATSAGSFQKINSVYALAEARSPGSGLNALTEVMTSVTGLPIDKAVVINFKGFEQLIDAFGGVTVDITNAFTDHEYPDGRGGVTTVSFSAGLQRLDGTQALEFTRSRHGSNGENSDFARAKRQQQVVVALANEALQLRTLTSPRRLSALSDMMKQYINTNLDLGDAADLAMQFQNADPANAPRLVIDDSPNGFLLNTIGPDGSFLLTPRGGNFTAIQNAVANLFNAAPSANEQTLIEVQNGTNIAGLAQSVGDKLQYERFKVIKFGNAERRDLATTVIYDYTQGQKSAAKNRLQELLPGAIVMTSNRPTTTNADFLIILGQNQNN